MERINKLIRELLSTPPKKESCNCGCHSCENVGNAGPVLNESLEARIIMTENMQHHVKNKLSITENTFRYGSESFLDLWAEARYLYSRNVIHVNDDDKHIILETNLGEYGMYNGKKVPLDMIIEEEDKEITDERGTKDDVEYAKDIKFQPLSNLLGIIMNKYFDTNDKTYLNLYDELQELFTQDVKNKINYYEVSIVLKKYLTDPEVNNLLTAAKAGLNEIKVFKPLSVLSLQSRIKATKDVKEKQSLVIECAEIVLPIWEEKFSNDDRPRKAIEATKKYLANPTEENKETADNASFDVETAVDSLEYDIEEHPEYFDGDVDEYKAAFLALRAIEVSTGSNEHSIKNNEYKNDANFAVDCAIKAIEKFKNLKEIKVFKPNSSTSFKSFLTLPFAKEIYDIFKNDKDIFKNSDIPMMIQNHTSEIINNIWERYTDVYMELDIENNQDYPDYLYHAYPNSKEELFDIQTGGVEDSCYITINKFILPFIATHLKQNGWTYVDDCDFKKDGRDIDIYDYIEVSADTSIKELVYDMFSNYFQEFYNLNESKDKKAPPLNKPKRGGSKKFYVYVRNPKTKKIKKVSFGDTTGLSAKLNNPKARKAFAARHDCKNKNDKTKASYWSCHLPRYAKLLGIKSNFGGYW